MAEPDLIYLDNNATTRVDPVVLEAMLPYLSEQYGNPSSAYRFGSKVARAINHARTQVAALIGAQPSEIVFTSGGTESNNSALNSALSLDPDRQHIVTTAVEHSAIMKHGETLARKGYEITWLKVDERGLVNLEELEKAIRSDTAIVSIMWANNETGVLSPIAEIAELCQRKGVLFHTDAVQAAGKIPIDVAAMPGLNFLSLSGHKLHCPKGVGALYVNRRTRFSPTLLGGSQESGKRAGTENVASIVAFGQAAEIAAREMEHENTVVRKMRDDFENAILAKVETVSVNGDREQRLPNTSNLSFENIESEGVLMLLDKEGVCVSAGSACTAGSLHPSHVLKAMGCSNERARSSLRFSFSRFNTPAEVERALEIVQRAVAKMRELTLVA